MSKFFKAILIPLDSKVEVSEVLLPTENPIQEAQKILKIDGIYQDWINKNDCSTFQYSILKGDYNTQPEQHNNRFLDIIKKKYKKPVGDVLLIRGEKSEMHQEYCDFTLEEFKRFQSFITRTDFKFYDFKSSANHQQNDLVGLILKQSNFRFNTQQWIYKKLPLALLNEYLLPGKFEYQTTRYTSVGPFSVHYTYVQLDGKSVEFNSTIHSTIKKAEAELCHKFLCYIQTYQEHLLFGTEILDTSVYQKEYEQSLLQYQSTAQSPVTPITTTTTPISNVQTIQSSPPRPEPKKIQEIFGGKYNITDQCEVAVLANNKITKIILERKSNNNNNNNNNNTGSSDYGCFTSIVSFKFALHLGDGFIIEEKTCSKVTMDETDIINGLKLIISGMEVGDKVFANIPSEFAYGANGLAPLVPPNVDIYAYIEMLEIQPKSRPSNIELSKPIQEKINRLESTKASGREQFQNGKVFQAMKIYKNSIPYMQKLYIEKSTEEEWEKFNELSCSILVSIAICYSKIPDKWKRVIKFCGMAKDYSDSNPKVFFYLSKAYENLNEFQLAIDNLKLAYKTSVNVKSDIYNLSTYTKDLTRLQNSLKSQNNSESEMYKKMFSQ
ncbi:hypothetical protein DLAC_02451 [Tieghemostelium lacteum]|uniref:peptidylprolyl isomerase n=1 Tax=Tieghemostelium lacteum TaxID=361077 RepID=A0A152A2X7_TIELA|nr:hypothetical protein DLAC_02451 [Tieghemostelium lacteum]|eukprot:KYR00455.1 hypothetical protein DLAC_02451 [Tieghemostelium lacteum]